MSSAAVQSKQKSPQQSVEGATKSLGARLRAIRKAQKVTLMELAKASGVDYATISRIETGVMTGTFESHIKIAAALGVKVTELYAGIEEARIKNAVTLQLPGKTPEAYVHQTGKSSISMLTTEILRKKLMPVLITIEPGGETQAEEARVGTERFVYVLEGSVSARVGEATHELKKGSSLYLDASIPHHFRNTGRSTVRCISVMTPPAL